MVTDSASLLTYICAGLIILQIKKEQFACVPEEEKVNCDCRAACREHGIFILDAAVPEYDFYQ